MEIIVGIGSGYRVIGSEDTPKSIETDPHSCSVLLVSLSALQSHLSASSTIDRPRRRGGVESAAAATIDPGKRWATAEMMLFGDGTRSLITAKSSFSTKSSIPGSGHVRIRISHDQPFRLLSLFGSCLFAARVMNYLIVVVVRVWNLFRSSCRPFLVNKEISGLRGDFLLWVIECKLWKTGVL